MISRKQTKKTKKNSPMFSPIIAALAITATLFLSPTLHAMHWSDTQKTLQRAVSLGQFERLKEVMSTLPKEEAQKYLPQIFCSAVYHVQPEMVEFMLEKGADPNMIAGDNGSGFTVLMHAALHSLPSIVSLLIAHGADALAYDAHGYCALNYCQGNHDSDYARNSAIILEEKMRELGCNTQKPLNVTLYQAVQKNREQDVSEFIKQILRLGADPNTQDRYGNTVLDLSLLQLAALNHKNRNSPIKEKIKTLYTYGADTSTYNISDYLTFQEITELEQERHAKQTTLADERYLKGRYAETPELAELSFEEQCTQVAQQELYDHCPLPTVLTQLTDEHLFGPANPRKRKRAETNANRYVDNGTGKRILSTKIRKLEKEEEEKC